MTSRDAIIHDVTYAHPIERVWGALTDREALAAWLMPNDFTPRIGHRFTLTVEPGSGWSGTIACEVVALEPPRLLSYTWDSSHPDAPHTVVTFTLAAVPGGTHLHLKHCGVAAGGPMGLTIRDILDSGWGSTLLHENLPAYLDRSARQADEKEVIQATQDQ